MKVNKERQFSNQYNFIISVIDCGIPSSPPVNSITLSITYILTTYNSVATYSCGIGYNLVGNIQRTCLPNGLWSEQPPQCQSQHENTYCVITYSLLI